MDRSLLSKPSSSKSHLLSSDRQNSPRWRSPSPMTASIIPPPIVQSTYASSSNARSIAQSAILEKPSQVHDRHSDLEADLQYLLDAQAEGLVNGFEAGHGVDDASTTGSTTPTARSVSRTGARRPARKKVRLRGARKGLLGTMVALAGVKEDELRDLADELRAKDGKLHRIDEWERKKAGLRDAANKVGGEGEAVRVERLRQQAETVGAEISALERQLEDRRVLHRRLMRQVAEVENAVQAKLASYTSSLRMLEEDVKTFLSIAPQENVSETANGDARGSVWQLPPKRRTLSMAKAQYNSDKDAVARQCGDVEHEKHALQEGAAIWKEVVDGITEFEQQMRADMQPQDGHSPDHASSRLRDLLQHMDALIQTLDSKLELARDRNWNLLIAAIGAELDALQRGRVLLGNALGLAREQSEDLVDTGGSPSGQQSPSSDHEAIQELDKSFETARRRGMSNGAGSSDDDPDPELLFSRADVDS